MVLNGLSKLPFPFSSSPFGEIHKSIGEWSKLTVKVALFTVTTKGLGSPHEEDIEFPVIT